jgi:hypothetical protein
MAGGSHLHFADDYYVSRIKGNYTMNKTSTEKAKSIWLGADHFFAQYRTKLWLAIAQT